MVENPAGATPLVRKLGIKPGHRVAVLNSPAGFSETLGALPEGVELVEALDVKNAIDAENAIDAYDVVLWFGTRRAELERIVHDVLAVLEQDGGLWIGWPKRTSRIATEVTDDVVRDVALPTGLVDNKICAIDATWSGVRLVIRRERRTK